MSSLRSKASTPFPLTGELMLSILASYAQEESLSASENQKWRVRKNFEEGKPWNGTLLGYRYRNGVYVIEPDEAETVRRIFREYLSGKGIVSIANDLNADGVRTRYENACRQGRRFTHPAQLRLLRKPASSEDFPGKPPDEKRPWSTRASCRCTTQRVHEAIISLEDYQAVQAEIAKRAKKYAPVGKVLYRQIPILQPDHVRSLRQALPAKNYCHRSGVDLQHLQLSGPCRLSSKQIPEPTLTAMTADLDIGDLTEIIAEDGNTLVFRFKDGRKAVKRWHDRSRAKSWTPEMKEAARQKR